MSTIVFENRSSCFESILSEATTVKLKLAAPDFSPKPAAPTDIDHRFPQTFNVGTEDYHTERDNYKNCPWAKKSSFISTLSPKSLELCTESIGSESGSDVITGAEADAIFSSPLFSSSSNPIDYSAKGVDSKRRLSSQKKANHSFPPPLTTMSVARPLTLQARRHVDGGRLVIEAVEAPFGNTYLRAERSDGRLRLSFLTAETAGEEEDEQDGESAAAAAEEEEGIEEGENEVGLDQPNEEIELEQSNEEIELDDNLEMEKYQWLSRCGGNRGGLCGNWKPAFWVATS